MIFLVDAQLPAALCTILEDLEHEALHVLDLANKDLSTDKEIRDFADQENSIVITKDTDFYYSHMTIQTPRKLLLISTGNINNDKLFDRDLVELSNI